MVIHLVPSSKVADKLLKQVTELLTAGHNQKVGREKGWLNRGIRVMSEFPLSLVIVDGGWSKRSHKHSYNVNSGVVISLMQNPTPWCSEQVLHSMCKHQCYRN